MKIALIYFCYKLVFNLSLTFHQEVKTLKARFNVKPAKTLQ